SEYYNPFILQLRARSGNPPAMGVNRARATAQRFAVDATALRGLQYVPPELAREHRTDNQVSRAKR
ncbi:MAG: hypothetical protein QGI33_08220, partial [Candidatus Brocadiia bacterium]|nr:hypothetical protein [Candidatus Brocadiia bacterium]